MNRILYILIFIYTAYSFITYKPISIHKHQLFLDPDTNGGYDERYMKYFIQEHANNIIIYDNNTYDVYKIRIFFDILEKIKAIEKIPKINVCTNLIDTQDYRCFTLKNGGLFDDWNRYSDIQE